jgi:hypothetical protein
LRRQPSLRSQLNQIRLWVRQGRTDAWIAHKLDVSIEQLERFKRDHDLNESGAAPGPPADPLSVPPPVPDAPSRRAEQAEDEDEPEEEDIEEEREEELEEELEPARLERGRRDRTRGTAARRLGADEDELEDEAEDEAEETERGGDEPRRRRRRGRRGGRRRRRPEALEATFDHGEDGYGLWFDPAVVENPLYAEHWAGHRAVVVTFSADAITIRRAGAGEADEPASDPASDQASDQSADPAAE